MHLEAFQDKRGKWRLRLKAGNAKIVFSGEAYSDRHEMNDTLASIAKAVNEDGVGLAVVTTHGEAREVGVLADWLERGE